MVIVSFFRSNTSQLVKPLKTSICITTEPYIPLANIKTRDSSIQKHKFGSSTKFEQSRFIELQPRKSKKKSHIHSFGNYQSVLNILNILIVNNIINIGFLSELTFV